MEKCARAKGGERIVYADLPVQKVRRQVKASDTRIELLEKMNDLKPLTDTGATVPRQRNEDATADVRTAPRKATDNIIARNDFGGLSESEEAERRAGLRDARDGAEDDADRELEMKKDQPPSSPPRRAP